MTVSEYYTQLLKSAMGDTVLDTFYILSSAIEFRLKEFATTMVINGDGASSLLVIVTVIVLTSSALWWGLSLLSWRGNTKPAAARGACALPLPPGNFGLLPVLGGDTLKYLDAYLNFNIKRYVDQKVARYGPIFKTSIMGQPTIVLDSPAGNKLLFHEDEKLVQGWWPKNLKALVNSNGLSETNGEAHRVFRQHLISNFLGVDVVHRYLHTMERRAKAEIEPWTEVKVGSELTIPAIHVLKNYAFRLICELTISLKDVWEVEQLRHKFDLWSEGFMAVPVNFPGTAFNRALKARDIMADEMGRKIEQRRKDLKEGLASKTQDFLSVMLTHPDETGHIVEDKILVHTLLLLLWTASDTTSSTLAMVLRETSKNPLVYRELIKEHASITRGKKNGEMLTTEDLRSMKYTWRVVQETMRMYPILLGLFREAKTSFEYQGYTIPKGFKLLVTSAPLLDPKVYKDPKTFDPSRFEKVGGGAPAFTYFPFGGGHRMCPGNEFAKASIILFLHHFLKHFKWTLVHPDEKIRYSFLATPEHGLPVKLTKIKPAY
ncbi:hypothetical protein Mapa_009374 [Marchantia paleacea]|nr:hypothetical protein Mapa_009374 [Marchantia paleacea]